MRFLLTIALIGAIAYAAIFYHELQLSRDDAAMCWDSR